MGIRKFLIFASHLYEQSRGSKSIKYQLGSNNGKNKLDFVVKSFREKEESGVTSASNVFKNLNSVQFDFSPNGFVEIFCPFVRFKKFTRVLSHSICGDNLL